MPRKVSSDELFKAPQQLPDICKILRLHQDGQLFKSLVDVISRVTGYHKTHVAYEGTILPRHIRKDGTLSMAFTPQFESMVFCFLDTEKAGNIFFPPSLPDIDGWRDVTSHEDPQDTLVWKSSDSGTIRGGVCLLFEYMKSNHVQVDGVVSETLKLVEQYVTTLFPDTKHQLMRLKINCRFIFVKWGPCVICGGGQCPDGNDIVYCGDCQIGYHQLCENITEIPEGEWLCVECDTIRKQAPATSPKKRFRSRDSPALSPADDDNQSMRRKRTRLSRVSALAASLDGENADVGPGTQSPVHLLTLEEREGTIFCVSRNDTKTYRIVRLGTTDSFETLTKSFAAKWGLRPERISRLFTRIPAAVDGLVELELGNEKDFEELITIIKRAWNNETVVYIPIILSEAGTIFVD